LRSDDTMPPDEPTDKDRKVDGVRITGAVPAGEDPLGDWDFDEGDVQSQDLPHWTDEPTGQIPSALIRERDDASTGASPVWREDSSDWKVDEEPFDPIILGADEEPRGALNPDETKEESRPWEFDLSDLPQGEAASATPAPATPPADSWSPEPEDLAASSAAAAGTPPAPRRRGGGRPPSGEESPPARRRPERASSPRRGDEDGTAPTGRNLPVAIATGVLIAVLVLVTFDLGTVLAMCLVVVAVTLAAAEAYAAFRRSGYHPATLLGLAATVALTIGSYNRGPQAFGLVTTLLFIFTVLWFLFGVEKTSVLDGISSTMLVYLWVGVIGSYAALLLDPTAFPNRHGLAFLLAAIVLVVVYDVAALFVGTSMGRHPLIPEISPNKTWEGLIGATVATIIVSVVIIPLMHPWTLSSALCLGILVAILSPLGDLAESMIKRGLGLKDMGRILPGHGGLLDRVDGLLFVLPATYYLVRAFHLA